MKYKAVIFDLFGTLVDSFTRTEFDKILTAQADALSAPHIDFRETFVSSFKYLLIGKYKSIEDYLFIVCKALGVQPSAKDIKSAAQFLYDFTDKTIVPEGSVLLALKTLKVSGYQLGLITDCGPDVPLLWQTSPLAGLIDIPVFSCQEKIKKPESAIYQRACQRLGRDPNECVYVGDGSSQELTGAKQAGLMPVLKVIDISDVYDSRPDIASWSGMTIKEIRDLPELLKHIS